MLFLQTIGRRNNIHMRIKLFAHVQPGRSLQYDNNQIKQYLLFSTQVGSYSTADTTTNSGNKDILDEIDNDNNTKQSFVQTTIKPGEWDQYKTNPLYRPKYRSNASIISAEDYAKRPTVSFTGEFDNFQDAMVTLSWLNQTDNERIYQLYIDLIQHSYTKHSITSHEYVVRVIAQKFNITSERVAAIIQLQHNQEQIEQHGGKLYHEAAQYMDTSIQSEIDMAYSANNNLQKPMDPFVEDPIGVNGIKEKKSWSIIDDIYDVDKMLNDIIIRDDDKARTILDNHIYIEDIDDNTVNVSIDKHCKKLIQQKEKLIIEQKEQNKQQILMASSILSSSSKKKKNKKKKKKTVEAEATVNDNETVNIQAILPPKWNETNGDGKKRQRYKYIAQMINTRQSKQQHQHDMIHMKGGNKRRSSMNTNNNSIGSYPNQCVNNTIVEYDINMNGYSMIRPATMNEIQYVSWKPKRHVQEFIYQNVKHGWLSRTIRNETNAWGKTPVKRMIAIDNDTSVSTSASVSTDDNSTAEEQEVVTVDEVVTGLDDNDNEEIEEDIIDVVIDDNEDDKDGKN